MERKRLWVLSPAMLQGLCRAEGLPGTGSKGELIERLVEKKEQQQSSKRLRTDESPEPEIPRITQVISQSFTAPAQQRAAAPLLVIADNSPDASAIDFQVLKCRRCGAIHDRDEANYNGEAYYFWCLRCRFEAMDPFNHVERGEGGVIYCGVLKSTYQEINLDVPHLKRWRQDSDIVEVRMIEVDGDSRGIRQIWPSDMDFEANGNMLFRIKAPPKGSHRRDLPKDITAGLKSQSSNRILIRTMDATAAYRFAIAIVHASPRAPRYLSIQSTIYADVCEEAEACRRACGLRTASDSGDRLEAEGVEYLSSDEINLICPLTLERVTSPPVRGKDCQHLRCFGLWAYCRSNAGMAAYNNRWSCPICGNTLRPSELCIDAYVRRILLETEDCLAEAVRIAKDGSWTVVESAPSEDD
eukprot:TRINITY_DN123033_c0_g1_i1.p1 TRINITY_DN123033_c0_g1~~TRINITY_DN123033_c0_g1_i1.p1  ORF type:complete len:455 (+),score=45.04 TRINITY_DN123033_c0_g1_i1:127-1365(+)